MFRIQIEAPGGPEVMNWVECEDLQPGPGQVLVEVLAAGVNFIDIYHRSGAYPMSWPGGIGLEGVGLVRALGEGATDLAIGQRVAWCDTRGSYATQVVVAAERLIAVPEGLSDDLAAAVLLQGMTAHFLTHDSFRVHAGQDVLVHAGAGGVGQLLIQNASALGARVITTVSTQEKAELALAAGAADVIRYDHEPIATRVRELTGHRGCAVVYDSVGKSTFEESLLSTARRGTVVLFGAASGQPEPLELARLGALGSLTVTRPTLFDFIAERDEFKDRASAVMEQAKSGEVTYQIGGRFPLREAARAHQALGSRATAGKVVLVNE